MKKKKEEITIVLDKDNLLYQPFALSKLGMDMNITQRKTFIAFIRKLQDNVKDIRKARYNGIQLSMFESIEQRKEWLGDDAAELSVHPRDIGIHPKNYGVAFDVMIKMEHIKINIAIGNNNYLRVPLFYLIMTPNIKRDENGNPCGYNRDPTIHFAIKRKDLERFFDDNRDNPIINYLDYTASSISGTYTLAIYQWLSKFKYENTSHKEEYFEFRRIIGLRDKDEEGNMKETISYPTLGELKKRVLVPAQKELDEMSKTGEADFSFSYEPVYNGSKREKNPDYLIFKIKLSNVGENIKNEKQKIIQDIGLERKLADRLRNDFQQSSTQINRIIQTLPHDRVGDFINEMDNLVRLIADKKVTIKKDLKSYANRIFTDTISGMIEANNNQVNNTPASIFIPIISAPVDIQEPEKPALPSAPQPSLNEEDMKKWDLFLEHISKEISEHAFKTWIKPCVPLSLAEGELKIWVQSNFFYEYIEDMFVEPFRKAIDASFGKGTKIMYEVATIKTK